MDANGVRHAFTRFFEERGHFAVPSASLIPHDPTVLFTIAGMVPFKPYFLGEEHPPHPRLVTVQKCFRANDIELIGTTSRHCTFFEMLGNFSFGDYFKEGAIRYAWELVTEVFGLDGERIWVTVHETDDEAGAIWLDTIGLPAGRLQRLGEENIWAMGDTGPCGTDSELWFDKGPEYGAEGGPASGADERYVEFWNLVFMELNRLDDGTTHELPKKNIDTGAGLDRFLALLQGHDSIFGTDLYTGMLDAAQSITGRTYGQDETVDVALRRIADHGRAMTMLVADGVLPSNEGRGYVLRRVVRRAVLAARRHSSSTAAVTPALVDAAVRTFEVAYPQLVADRDLVASVLEREEQQFDRTLRTGLGLLETALAHSGVAASKVIDGELAFRLHDTHGFPVELTEELAAERGIAVDRVGFDEAMREQRERARAAAKSQHAADESAYRSLLDAEGPAQFIGRDAAHYTATARIQAVLEAPDGLSEIFLDHTPFYAEGGGQVGDTGTIATESGTAEVLDTVSPLPGVIAHRARVRGSLHPGQEAIASIDRDRREAIRRNHTATHLLHAALRDVLGDHVRQQGSLVAPDRLRFDFSHHGAIADEEHHAILEMANRDVIADEPVETTETSREEAQKMGAVAFFGDKYGETVRVVRAGPHSLEFCGGTHVRALGAIGTIQLVSESSIGANTRRIEAVTALGALRRAASRERLLGAASAVLHTDPEHLPAAVEKVADRLRAAEHELGKLKEQALRNDARSLAESAQDGVVVSRADGRPGEELRSLAGAVRHQASARVVVLAGASPGGTAALAASTDGAVDAAALVREVAALIGGGGGGSSEVALAGGKNPAGINAALDAVRAQLGIA
ncbi:MAG TPA: alanine--tRNA ligase [Acidimicrobiales bacterium]|nr:alanine--tRNA ligase [Acidimicrobiales bacterium]